jgi:predicted transcriptional regulator
MTEIGARNDFVELATQIVSAYVSKNSVQASDLPRLIADVHQAWANMFPLPGLPEGIRPLADHRVAS